MSFAHSAAASQAPLSNWHAPVVEPPIGDSHPPRLENIKKSPYLRTGSSLNDGGEGIDSLRSLRAASQAPLSNWHAPVVEPQSGILIPRVGRI